MGGLKSMVAIVVELWSVDVWKLYQIGENDHVQLAIAGNTANIGHHPTLEREHEESRNGPETR